MDGLLGDRLGAGIDGDAHLPTRFLESSCNKKAKSAATNAQSRPALINSSLQSPNFIVEALKHQLCAQDKWGDLNRRKHLTNDLSELLVDDNPFALEGNSEVPLARMQEIFNPASLSHGMIMGTSLARQCASANPPFKRSRRTKGKTRTDPVSLQRRKTRHAFTERDRTRKLAARIVEMGNILNAAGIYCKQEKLPILTEAVKYVYELQDRLQRHMSKKLTLYQKFKELKEAIAQYKDERSESESNIIFHDLVDTIPCAGKCDTIDYYAAFNGKSFPVVIVNSKDFTLLATNKLFRNLVKKGNDSIIGCFLPQIMRDRYKHMESYLQCCVALLQDPEKVEHAAANLGCNKQSPSSSKIPILTPSGSLSTNVSWSASSTTSGNITMPLTTPDFASQNVSSKSPLQLQQSRLFVKELLETVNSEPMSQKSTDKTDDAHILSADSTIGSDSAKSTPDKSTVSKGDALLADIGTTQLIKDKATKPPESAVLHRASAAATQTLEKTVAKSNSSIPPVSPLSHIKNSNLKSQYGIPSLSFIGKSGASGKPAACSHKSHQVSDGGGLLEIPALPGPLIIPGNLTYNQGHRNGTGMQIAGSSMPATKQKSTSQVTLLTKAQNIENSARDTGRDLQEAATTNNPVIPPLTVSDPGLDTGVEPLKDSKRVPSTAAQCGKDSQPQPSPMQSISTHEFVQQSDVPVLYKSNPHTPAGEIQVNNPVASIKSFVDHKTQRDSLRSEKSAISSSKTAVAKDNPLPCRPPILDPNPMNNTDTAAGLPVGTLTEVHFMESNENMPTQPSFFTVLLHLREYVVATNLLDQSKIQVSFLPKHSMRVSNSLPPSLVYNGL